MSSQITPSDIVYALELRSKALHDAFQDPDLEEIKLLGSKVQKLGEQVRGSQEKRNIEEAKRVDPVSPASRGELMAALHDLAVAIGNLEASHFHLPPDKQTLRAFRCKIAWIGSKRLADERYLGFHGHYDKDARNSSWQVREINRLITYRERRWGWIGVIVAFALGVLSIGVATMAIPTEKSIYCRITDRMRLDLCKPPP